MGDSRGGPEQRLREYVDLAQLRPAPPREMHELFQVEEELDVYLEDGWHFGEIREIHENSKYLVAMGGGSEEVEFGQWELRRHLERSGNGI
ncbi:hypothetical protein ACJRO7_022830 [Eucalyptus globulus]|uniref:Uncharacterized protein n=1 Tax=Eucalyptus globulus TaxID=34317 RepID=A0ABD3K0Z7_EUCGL